MIVHFQSGIQTQDFLLLQDHITPHIYLLLYDRILHQLIYFQMFRVLSSLVQSVGTCLLIVGLCFQIYSLNSNRWITWVTQDANEGLFYFEGKSK